MGKKKFIYIYNKKENKKNEYNYYNFIFKGCKLEYFNKLKKQVKNKFLNINRMKIKKIIKILFYIIESKELFFEIIKCNKEYNLYYNNYYKLFL